MGKRALADPAAVRAEREAKRQERELALMTLGARVYASDRDTPSFRNAPKRGRMNKTEAAYAEQLERLKDIGHIHEWMYGTLSLRLADRTWYRPDFLVATVSAIEIHEVKGHWEDDARVKFKVAAELYPMFRFLAVRREKSGFVIIETLNPH